MGPIVYRVNNIFPSIQGEGTYSGTPSWFIRFSGCNLRNKCVGCDTDFDSFVLMTKETIISKVLEKPNIRHVVITGGEPTLQFIQPLLSDLNDHHIVTLETNGIQFPEASMKHIDLYSCAPKFCNFKVEFNDKVIDNICSAAAYGKLVQVKFVVKNKKDVDFAKMIIASVVKKIGYPASGANIKFLFQPFESKSTYTKGPINKYKEIVLSHLDDSLLNVVGACWCLQSHKVVGVD